MKKPFYLLLVSVLFVSCAKERNSGEESGENDSIAKKAELPRLPGKSLESANAVDYSVDIVDSMESGRLSSLADLYDDSKSIMTFREGLKRQANFGGRLKGVPTQMKVSWSIETEEDRSDKKFGPWGGGTGWTGQPLYVEWGANDVKRLKESGMVNGEFDGKEIIVGSLCGKVYFLNPDNGKQTREPLAVGNTIKGTVSFDPTFNGFLYVGHGTPVNRPFGCVTIDLFQNKLIEVVGEDSAAYKRWGAYDSSPLRIGQFLFRPGENGGLYKYLVTERGPKLHSVMRYKVGGFATGVESSMAVYANYGYLADNRGNVIAVDLDTLKPIWHYALGDDSDATPVIAEEDGVPYVYVGCEVDLVARGYAVFAKLNGLTGEEIWKIEPEAQRRQSGKKHFDGGFYSSSLLGHGDSEGLIFTNLVKNTKGANGVFVALDRKDGTVKYELPLQHYAWSSPVGFIAGDNRFLVVTADCSGVIYVIDGKSGEILLKQQVGRNFESSPLVIGNSIVIGSRGNGIYKVSFE